jgi:SAM-dependent methyltransferase
MDWKRHWNHHPSVLAADPSRQVARTFARQPYSEPVIAYLVSRLVDLLAPPGSDSSLLDLACGNGMITSRLARNFEHVTGVDFSEPLIETARTWFPAPNVEYLLGDVCDLGAIHRTYDRVLLNFSLQYFDRVQAGRMFQRLATLVNPGARIVLGDVADGDRRWNFYRGIRGRARYAFDALRDRPIIGHWWRPADLLLIAERFGWTLTLHYQDQRLPNHYFRFDATLAVPAEGNPASQAGAASS